MTSKSTMDGMLARAVLSLARYSMVTRVRIPCYRIFPCAQHSAPMLIKVDRTAEHGLTRGPGHSVQAAHGQVRALGHTCPPGSLPSGGSPS